MKESIRVVIIQRGPDGEVIWKNSVTAPGCGYDELVEAIYHCILGAGFSKDTAVAVGERIAQQ